MHEGEATVWFGAANADTRNALEQSLPRLRELFASQGLVLADAGVHRETRRATAFKPNRFAGRRSRSRFRRFRRRVNSVTLARAGLIDTYVCQTRRIARAHCDASRSALRAVI